MNEVLQLALMVLGFIAILYGAYYVTKLLAPKISGSKGSRYIKVVDRVYLGNDKSICIIQIGEKLYLVGVTDHHIEPMGLLDGGDLIPIEVDMGKPFLSFFNEQLNKGQKSEDDRDRMRQMQDGVQEIKRNIREM